MAKKSFKIKGNLAEALGDTVTSAMNNAGELHIEIIPIRKISLDPENPRDLVLGFDDLYKGLLEADKHFKRKTAEKESLSSLASSIKSQGIINPIVVYKYHDQYRLIAGERRTLASIIAERVDIPAKVLTTRPDQLKLSLIQWIENIEREDLTLWERLNNLEKILFAYAEHKNINIKDISPTDLKNLLGCSLQHAVNYHHLLNSPEILKTQIQQGEIKNIDKAAFISKSSTTIQPTLVKACLQGATLSELKKISYDSNSMSAISKRSDINSKIHFGFTNNVNVAKKIVETLIKSQDFQHLNDKFENIRLDDHKSITNAFRQILKLLEKA